MVRIPCRYFFFTKGEEGMTNRNGRESNGKGESGEWEKEG